MKKKLLVIGYIVILLLVLKLIFSFIINQIFILKYNKGIYEEGLVKSLFTLNISETYVAYYNYGNILYKNNRFDRAIEEYKKALQMNPPKKKECSIRINYALAMLRKINEENKSDENKKKTFTILSDAKNILCENGCAHFEDDNGHSREAERLKAEIERRMQELKINVKGQDNKTNSQNENNKEQEEIEKKLKELQAEARGYRDEKMGQNIKDIFYTGKSW